MRGEIRVFDEWVSRVVRASKRGELRAGKAKWRKGSIS